MSRLLLVGASAMWLSQSVEAQPTGLRDARTTAIGQSEVSTTVTALAEKLEDFFVLPEAGRKYAEGLRAGLAEGTYNSLRDRAELAKKLTADLQAIHPDGHLRVLAAMLPPLPPPGAAGAPEEPEAIADGRPPENGIKRSGWITPQVAYVEFTSLPGNAATIGALRAFLDTHRSASALIIDARDNSGGGLAEMDLLFARLYAKPTDLLYMDVREAIERTLGPPPSTAGLHKIAGPRGIVRRVHRSEPAPRGERLDAAKLFVLTSNDTASAAEHLALALQRTHRATLIGGKTAGAGHFGGPMPISEHFAAWIPVGRTFDPNTGKGWEGRGVTPNVLVPAEKALDEALSRSGVKLTGEQALANLR